MSICSSAWVVSFAEIAFRVLVIVGRQGRLVDQRHHVLRGEVVLRVGERDEVVGDDLRRGGEHVGGLHLAVHQGRQGNRAGLVQRVEALERQAVVLLQARQAVGAGLELRRAAEGDVLTRAGSSCAIEVRWCAVAIGLGDGDRVLVLRGRRS